MAKIKKAMGGYSTPTKAKSGKSFPDLNKDGKITKADILKGRGVIAEKGSKVAKAKKAANGVMSSTTTPMQRAERARVAIERGEAPMRRKARAAASMASAPVMKKGGKATKKQAATAIAMKKAGKAPKKMMVGGKCKYGC